MTAQPPLDYASPEDKTRSRRRWVTIALAVFFAGGALLLLGLVLIAPSGGRSREAAYRIKCGSNLSHIGKALILYAADQPDGAYPPGFAELLLSQDVSTDEFCCLSSNATKAASETPVLSEQAALLTNPEHCSYIPCFDGLTNRSDADDVLVIEPLENHLNAGGTILFGDGHVEFVVKGPLYDQLLQDAAGGVRPVRVK